MNQILSCSEQVLKFKSLSKILKRSAQNVWPHILWHRVGKDDRGVLLCTSSSSSLENWCYHLTPEARRIIHALAYSRLSGFLFSLICRPPCGPSGSLPVRFCWECGFCCRLSGELLILHIYKCWFWVHVYYEISVRWFLQRAFLASLSYSLTWKAVLPFCLGLRKL